MIMPTFVPGQPITVAEPKTLVENQFAPGRYRFQLVVTDEGGLESDPAELIVTVHDVVRPPRPFGPAGPLRPDLTDHFQPRRPELIRPIRPQR